MRLGRSRDLTRQEPPPARRRELGLKPKFDTNTPPAPPPTRVPGQDPDLEYPDVTTGSEASIAIVIGQQYR